MSREQPIKLPDSVRRKPKGSAVVRVFGWLLALGLVLSVVAVALGLWGYATYTSPGPHRQAVIVNIPASLDRVQVANLLHDQGVVSSPMVMGLASLVQRFRGAYLRSGEYEFPVAASMAEVFNIIASGRVVTYKLTVPEGWTSEMAAARMRTHDAMAGAILAIPPEGTVIANTHLFARGKNRQQLLDEMVAAQAKLVDDIWNRRKPDSVLKDKNQLLTLASIVEKETAKAEERPRVAAVFINRLKAGIRLQSDPTIIYGLVGGKGKLDRPISLSDIDSDTPYNTYRINGLPPGPIASPGQASLEAVIAPAQTLDLYFVADGTGGHVFATTLDEHNANVKKWRAVEAGTADPAAAPAPAALATQGAATPDVKVTQPQLPNVAEEQPTAAPAVVAAQAPAATAAQAPASDAAATDTPAPAAAAARPANADSTTPKPGTLVKVGKVLVPIPMLKKAKP